MYRVRLFVIMFFNIRIVVSRILGEADLEKSTNEQMDIAALTFDVWCKFQTNLYDCGKNGRHAYRFYYDVQNGGCKSTTIGDCENNYNNFWDLKECNDICAAAGQRYIEDPLTPNAYCRLQPDFGLCFNYYPMWYFEVTTRTCKGFSYSGCGGNQNRFASASDCTMTCLPDVEYKPW